MTTNAHSLTFSGSTLSVVELLHDRMNAPLDPVGQPRYSSGMFPLDAVLDGGLRRQDLALITGRPGSGKTIMALQWARAVAMQGARALYVCYEHSPETLLERFTALEVVSAGREQRPQLHEPGGPGNARDDGRHDANSHASESRLADTFDRVKHYGSRLQFAVAARYTDVDAIEALLPDGLEGDTVIFVDYVNKIPTPRTTFSTETERTAYVVQSLKDLALRRNVTVVAIAAADKDALTKRRLRMHDMSGSSALMYEADVVLVLNEKSHAASKTHLAYDAERAEQAERYLVVSVEKNRAGAAGFDLEFVKDYANFSIDPDGTFLSERLADDIMYVD